MDKSKILDGLQHLPAMPHVVKNVMDSMRNVNTGSEVLAQKIALDQGLSAKVLQVANSSYYGMSGKIGSIRNAIAVLGLDHVLSLVVSAGVMGVFPPTVGRLFDRHAHWKRSFRVATYADALAKCMQQDQQFCFTAGMFHDIGAPALDFCVPDQFADLLRQQAASGTDLMVVERSVMGFDHAEIGGEMAKLWGLPEEIDQAIRYWRTPEHKPVNPVSHKIYVSALLEDGYDGNAILARMPSSLAGQMKIDWDRLGKYLPEPDDLDDLARQMLSS